MNRNDILRLPTDDEAVAPVVAAVLMIAVTVILGAIIGSLVIGVGSEQANAPDASLEFDYTHGTSSATVEHRGGDEAEAARLSVKETGSTDGVSIKSGMDEFVAGNVVASGTHEPDETIRVVWRHPGSDDTTILAESRGPT